MLERLNTMGGAAGEGWKGRSYPLFRALIRLCYDIVALERCLQKRGWRAEQQPRVTKALYLPPHKIQIGNIFITNYEI